MVDWYEQEVLPSSRIGVPIQGKQMHQLFTQKIQPYLSYTIVHTPVFGNTMSSVNEITLPAPAE